jgi:hypothetical protein
VRWECRVGLAAATGAEVALSHGRASIGAEAEGQKRAKESKSYSCGYNSAEANDRVNSGDSSELLTAQRPKRNK